MDWHICTECPKSRSHLLTINQITRQHHREYHSKPSLLPPPQKFRKFFHTPSSADAQSGGSDDPKDNAVFFFASSEELDNKEPDNVILSDQSAKHQPSQVNTFRPVQRQNETLLGLVVCHDATFLHNCRWNDEKKRQ